MVDYSTKAFTFLFIITAYNILLALLMIGRFIPVMSGMAMSFVGMGVIFGIAVMVLMPGEKPWRRPKPLPSRRDKAIAEAEATIKYWNDLIKKDGLG